MDLNHVKADGEYTDVDLNSTGTTELYNPDGDGTVSGVYLLNGGSTAEVQLEVTDGTDTAVLAVPGAGSSVEFGDTVVLGSGDSLQINVTTAEGSAQTNTAVVLKAD